ncbi:hypothetical protein GCM10022198_09110 [Klugiella xanthotipulae]|nr:DUF1801 domain-containing protein [Klugiella xanthotipulae]
MSTTPESTVEAYLAQVRPDAVGAVRQLDRIVRETESRLEVSVRYGILMYALDGDWRHWVCAVNATSKVVVLRFLYGVILDDPLGVLRQGSAELCNWDFAPEDLIEETAVAGYVSEAVARHAYFRENAVAINVESKKKAAARKRK